MRSATIWLLAAVVAVGAINCDLVVGDSGWCRRWWWLWVRFGGWRWSAVMAVVGAGGGGGCGLDLVVGGGRQ